MICEQCGEIILGDVSYCKKCGCIVSSIDACKKSKKETKINSDIKRDVETRSDEEKYYKKENEWLLLIGRFSKKSKIKRSQLPLSERINIEILMKIDLIGFIVSLSSFVIIFLLLCIWAQLADGVRVW